VISVKWYWWMLIVIVALVIIIGIWYYVEYNRNQVQLKQYMIELGLFDKNANLKEIHDYTLNACKESNSKLVATLVGTSGIGVYISFDYNTDYNKEVVQNEIITFQNQLCDCINSKGFSIIDLFNPVEKCVVIE